MAGWISGPIGDAAAEAQGSDAFASSIPDSVDLFSTTKQVARGIGNAQATLGTVDEYGRQTSAPEPTISADEANQKYAITPSSGLRPLKFDNPVPESVAQSMYAAKKDEMERADVAARASVGVGNASGRFLLNLGASFLDPVNAAAMFVPGLGETTAARMLGMGALDAGGVKALGLGARTAVKAVAGATAGATGGAVLGGLHYALGQQEQEDYSMSSMLSDVLMGTVMGGGLHAVVVPALKSAAGSIGDAISSAFGRTRAAGIVDADPVTRDTANRVGVAALVEGRPLDVAPVIELGGAQFDAVQGRAEIDRLYQQARELRTEIPAVPGAIRDPATEARLSSIEDELTDPDKTPTMTRRLQLQQEHTMLTEGSPGDAAQAGLDEARGASQRQGLQTALDNTNRQIVDLVKQVQTSDAAKRAGGAPDPEAMRLSQNATVDAEKVARWHATEKLEKPATSADPEAMATPPSKPAEVETMTRADLEKGSKNGGTDGEVDAGKMASTFHDTIAEAVARGDEVVHVNGEGKETPLSSKAGRTVQKSDGAGIGWMGALTNTADRIEIRKGSADTATAAAPKPMTQLEAAVKQMRDNGDMDPATAREYDALTSKAETDEGTAKALEAAAQCMMGKF